YLLEAMPSVLRDYPSTNLLLIGEARRGETLAGLKELIQRLALEDSVNFLGKIDNAKLPLYYNAADVFVLPSLTEGLGLVLVEAAACNCPIIGTRVGGVVDLMETLGKGILVPPRSPEALALAIKTVFENPEEYNNLRETAIHYSWDSILEKNFKVLEDLQQEYFSKMTS
ncbi:MAG: glycosyltransferase, partial [Candidatus Brocadiales bacterium]|nr:glycosyltransferase [Candidatus Brocadiales bacterium]